MMGTIAAIEEEIEEEFGLFDDWMEKYDHLIGLGKSLPMIDEKYKTDEYLIHGCQSKVWMRGELKNGVIEFSADSDAIITKGIVALLVQVLSGQTPGAILDAKLGFIDRIGLREHLSSIRGNGLNNMILQMKRYAQAFAEK